MNQRKRGAVRNFQIKEKDMCFQKKKKASNFVEDILRGDRGDRSGVKYTLSRRCAKEEHSEHRVGATAAPAVGRSGR